MKKLFTYIIMLSLVVVLAACKTTATTEDSTAAINTALSGINLGDLTAVTADITLPVSANNGVIFTWNSNKESVLTINTTTNKAVVTRPAAGQPNVEAVLTVTASKGTKFVTKSFNVTVIALPVGAQAKLEEAKDALTIPVANLSKVIEDTFVLNTKSKINSEVSISWASDNETALTIGAVNTTTFTQLVTVKRAETDTNVKLTATLSIDNNGTPLTITKAFDLVIAKLADTDEGKVNEAVTELAVFGLDFVKSDITLPIVGKYNTTITWVSNHAAITVSGAKGFVTRPGETVVVTLTATIKSGNVSKTKAFVAIVLGVNNTYTYRTSTTPTTNINPQMETLAQASDLYNLIGAGLYEGDYDFEGSGYAKGDFSEPENLGYKMFPNLASDYPVDVNGDGKVWNIPLRTDIKWQDGIGINAHDYVYSYKMLLDPLLINKRASVLYSDLPVLNAEEYFKQGKGYRNCLVKYVDTNRKDAALGIAKDKCNAENLAVDNPETTEVNEAEVSRTIQNYPASLDFAQVGIKAIDDYTLQFTLKEKVSEWDFTENFLDAITGPVRKELYEAGMNENRTRTDYGSSINKIMSYGEYKLTAWEPGVIFLFEKNDLYPHKDNYRFDYIRIEVINDQVNRINEFKAGRLDVVGVAGKYYPEFENNPNKKMAPQTATFRWATNIGDRADGKTNPMMQYQKFRQALYYAIDREAMVSTVNKPAIAQQGLLSPQYVIHYTSDVYYRDTPQGQSVFADRSPDTNGYNPTLAKQLFEEAYAQAVADGKITDGQKVWVELAMLDTESNWTSNEWVKNVVEKSFGANAGGPNASKFEFRIAPYTTDALDVAEENANFDIMFYGWQGEKFNPIGLMGWVWNENFDYMNEKGWKPGAFAITVDLPNKNKGKEVTTETRTLHQWLVAIEAGGDLYEEYVGRETDYLNICAAIESRLLDEVIGIPLFTSVATTVYTDRVIFESGGYYHPWMAYGGFKYMYLNKSDQELAAE